MKGGIQVLNVRQCPNATIEIEMFLNPRGGDPDKLGYSGTIQNYNYTSNQPNSQILPRYSVGRVQLPQPNDDMTCDEISMWEAVQVKTEVVGAPSMLDLHSPGRLQDQSTTVYNNLPIAGPSLHFFAVGGDPMDLQALQQDQSTIWPSDLASPPIPSRQQPDKTSTVLDLTRKGKCDRDDHYPVELWHPDPFRNENTRYYGNFTGGATTPPVVSFTNTVSTILLDANGVGPLCRGNYVYITAADIMGLRYMDQTPGLRWRLLPRYFRVTFRQRMVKNPYPINQLINELYDKMTPSFVSQNMSEQVEDVRVFQGLASLQGAEVPRPLNCPPPCGTDEAYQNCQRTCPCDTPNSSQQQPADAA